MAPKVNYKWWADDRNFGGGVYETPEAVDGKRVFSTFTAARTALGDHFDGLRFRADSARYFARHMKKADLKNGEVTL